MNQNERREDTEPRSVDQQQACSPSLWTVGVGDEVEYHPGTIAGKRTLHKITRSMPTRVVVNGYTFRRDTGFRYGAEWACASIRVPNVPAMASAATEPTPKEAPTPEGGLPIRDLFAFAGVRQIIGDPHGKLMQDEVADRIQEFVNVLRGTVGIMDALKLILPGMTAPERKAVAKCRDQIREMLDEQMPEWDDVCRAIHEANAGEKNL